MFVAPGDELLLCSVLGLPLVHAKDIRRINSARSVVLSRVKKHPEFPAIATGIDYVSNLLLKSAVNNEVILPMEPRDTWIAEKLQIVLKEGILYNEASLRLGCPCSPANEILQAWAPVIHWGESNTEGSVTISTGSSCTESF